jgi:hypothetical protein
MKDRSLAQPVEELALAGHKIAFVSGPRQCGKTTLAKMLLRKRKVGLYRNWDENEFRRAWAKNPSAIVPHSQGKDVPLVVFDEIHKDRRWKSDYSDLVLGGGSSYPDDAEWRRAGTRSIDGKAARALVWSRTSTWA